MAFFAKITERVQQRLQKTSSKLSEGLRAVFTHRKLDKDTLEDLYDTLIASDFSVNITDRLIAVLQNQKHHKDIDFESLKELLANEIEMILSPAEHKNPFALENKAPTVMVMVGVNGTGKTTTIAKMTKQFIQDGKRVHMAAADTFRAAAVEQLAVWADRLHVPLSRGMDGSDPASVVYQAYQDAKGHADILLVDTAGRLHNKSALMDELQKIHRVLKKIDNNLPHHVILVLDATTGQNARQQVEIFSKTIPLSGIILTKLDGTAKGGILVTLADQFKLPIYALGMGEGFDDLHPFSAKVFARSLLGLDS